MKFVDRTTFEIYEEDDGTKIIYDCQDETFYPCPFILFPYEDVDAELMSNLFNSIPVSKVKELIERIDYDIKKTKEIISNNRNIYANNRRNDYQIVRLKAMNTKSLDIKNRLEKLVKGK